MINALDKKINALAARHGWHISPRTGDGLHWYEIAPMDRPDRDAILRTLARCKGLAAETWEPYIPTAWACVIRMTRKADAIRAAGASPATLQGVGAHGSTRSTITTNTIGGYTL